MSRLWSLESLLRRMDNHYKYYDNNMNVEDIKIGDDFWLIGYNIPITFVGMKDEKLVFDGNLGSTSEYTIEQFKKLIPC